MFSFSTFFILSTTIYNMGYYCLIQNEEIRIGFLVPLTGHSPAVVKGSVGAMDLATEKVNSDPQLSALREQNITFSFEEINTGCTPGKALDEIVRRETTTDVFVGGYCDNVCECSALVLAEKKKIMVSYGCALPVLSRKDLYPTFARLVGAYNKVARIYCECLRSFNYTKVAIFIGEEYVFQQTLVELEENLQIYKIHYDVYVSYHSAEHMSNTIPNYASLLQTAKKAAHVFILLTYAEVAGDILQAAHTIGMTNEQYIFFTLHAELDLLLGNRTNSNDIFTGVLDLTYYEPLHDRKYLEFLEKVKKKTLLRRQIKGIEVDGSAAAMYNSVLLIALAVNKTVAEGKNKSSMFTNLFNWKFTGIDGSVTIDEFGDREQKYMLRNIYQGRYRTVASIDTVLGLQHTHQQIVWPGRLRAPPLGRPICGFDNEFCRVEPYHWTEISISLVLCFIIICIIVGTICYRHWIKKKYQSKKWKLAFEDLSLKPLEMMDDQIDDNEKNKADSFQQRHIGFTIRGSKPCHNLLATYTYNNAAQEVRVKYLTAAAIDFNVALKEEISQVYTMKHDNLNRLIGVCPTSLHVCIVSANCRYGSLRDTLMMQDRQYDWSFKTQFALDIAKGMQYLHDSERMVHGHLTSLNVLVDSLMQCKIEDYGMGRLRRLLKKKHLVEDTLENQLWIAPEALQDLQHWVPSKKGDVYAFGIILQEISQRDRPYAKNNVHVKDILENVRTGQRPPFRPLLNQEDTPKFYFDLTIKCWEQDSEKRPTFMQAIGAIRNSPKELHEINLVGKIANQMDDLVKKKTKEIEKEKSKSDRLLSAMLPRSVIGRLRNGLEIEPEKYESATISFCDIVAFTTLAAKSSPLQIVNFLNDLYREFDQITRKYNVYKVETIGDNYMVVSNVPDKCDSHASEVANVALDVIDTVRHYKVDHQLDWKLQVRIGINTGNCFAGVVGTVMPRYCLFGYTVVLSSRMESTGKPMKIHITESTKEELDQIGGFICSECYHVTIKGKVGTVKAYFLEGRQEKPQDSHRAVL